VEEKKRVLRLRVENKRAGGLREEERREDTREGIGTVEPSVSVVVRMQI